MQRREFIGVLGAAVAAVPFGGHGETRAATAFPTRAITLVVPYPAGGARRAHPPLNCN